LLSLFDRIPNSLSELFIEPLWQLAKDATNRRENCKEEAKASG